MLLKGWVNFLFWMFGIFLLIGVVVWALTVGSVSISFSDIVASFKGEESAIYRDIVWNVRSPRVVMALLVGALLSLGGTVAQAVFRNPLADPYVIGISAGAVSGAALAFLLGLPDSWYGIFSFISATGTAFLVFRLAGRQGAKNTALLLIIGVALSSFLSAFTSLGMYLAGQDSYRVMMWTMGYLGSASWGRICLLLVPLFAAILYFLYVRHDLDVLSMSEEEAHSLGIVVPVFKKRLLLIISLMVAFSVAFAGMIGFVGLIVPHGLRLLVGGSHKKLLPAAAVGGALFLVIADTVARVIVAPMEIPIGVVTSFVGAPFFLFLVYTSLRGRVR